MTRVIWLKPLREGIYVQAERRGDRLSTSESAYPETYTVKERIGEYLVLYQPGRHYFGGTGMRQHWSESRYFAARPTGEEFAGGISVELMHEAIGGRGLARRCIRACINYIEAIAA